MTSTTANTFQPSTETGLREVVHAFIAALQVHLADRRERKRLYTELAECSDRELADMNISRADIGYIVGQWQRA
ncbi:MAG: DUF1127 domain-containing protein [Janthinobacterium lividum]|jgi:uncharacterized protein YjiS (DUF1127 family)